MYRHFLECLNKFWTFRQLELLRYILPFIMNV